MSAITHINHRIPNTFELNLKYFGCHVYDYLIVIEFLLFEVSALTKKMMCSLVRVGSFTFHTASRRASHYVTSLILLDDSIALNT